MSLSYFGVLACVVLVAAGLSARPVRGDGPPPLILVSFDGWRWDYAGRFDVPNLRRVIRGGVRAENLIPSFPSKTFPNHYTLVTGRYPGEHGIVANTIKDVPTGRLFSLSNRREVQDAMWWGGEPLWVRVQNAGYRAAATFWPGSEAPILGQRPHIWAPFDESVVGTARVDRVLALLDRPAAERPVLLTLYFEDVDTAAHAHGPEAAAVRAAAQRVDGYLGRLLQGLDRRGITDSVNIVLTSDHGLAATSPDRVIALDDYISLDEVEIVERGALLMLYPRPGRTEPLHEALVRAHPRLRVYRREETPARWHFRDHPRIPPLVGVADEGWLVLRRGSLAERIALRIGARGDHGYDPESMTMRGIFVAAGPSFRRGVTVPAFENVHVYNALAAALRLDAAPNSGDPAVARQLLR